jgi:hypothetical protein
MTQELYNKIKVEGSAHKYFFRTKKERYNCKLYHEPQVASRSGRRRLMPSRKIKILFFIVG